MKGSVMSVVRMLVPENSIGLNCTQMWTIYPLYGGDLNPGAIFMF